MTKERVVMTPREACAALGLSKNTCYKAIEAGEIPSVKVGGRYLIPRMAFEMKFGALPTSSKKARAFRADRQ